MGWNGRLFADGSRGKLDSGDNLPLQPADRIGASAGYRQADWRAGLSWTHARGQDRLAGFEARRRRPTTWSTPTSPTPRSWRSWT
jgi:iron complex outermembrane receptor protein